MSPAPAARASRWWSVRFHVGEDVERGAGEAAQKLTANADRLPRGVGRRSSSEVDRRRADPRADLPLQARLRPPDAASAWPRRSSRNQAACPRHARGHDDRRPAAAVRSRLDPARLAARSLGVPDLRSGAARRQQRRADGRARCRATARSSSRPGPSSRARRRRRADRVGAAASPVHLQDVAACADGPRSRAQYVFGMAPHGRASAGCAGRDSVVTKKPGENAIDVADAVIGALDRCATP